MDRRYYSPKKENKQHNAVIEKVRFTYKQGEFDLFFNVLKVRTGCRDPPYQFVFKKFKLIGGKKNGKSPKKKKK